MASQLGLPIQDRVRASLESAGKEIRAACRLIAKRTKQGESLARAARMDPGNFSKALAGDTYKLDLEVLPAFFAEDQERHLVRLLCRLCGGSFVPDPELTPEDRLKNVLSACRRSGAAGEAILRDAGEEL
jgi:hypothetical protein